MDRGSGQRCSSMKAMGGVALCDAPGRSALLPCGHAGTTEGVKRERDGMTMQRLRDPLAEAAARPATQKPAPKKQKEP